MPVTALNQKMVLLKWDNEPIKMKRYEQISSLKSKNYCHNTDLSGTELFQDTEIYEKR